MTPSGQAILLGWDGPVTGGYPVIAAVIAADLPRLAQLRPGAALRFAFVTVEGGADSLEAATGTHERSHRMGCLIELNADVGEGGADAFVIPHVQRISIACGGHAGDRASMRAALCLAREHGAEAGAHPGYPDPANFGRRALDAGPAEITRWVYEQTLALQAVAEELEIQLFHVKPHGALYNRAAVDRETAQAVIAAMQKLEGLALVALAGSPLVHWARQAGLPVLEEAFADRRYLKNGQLAPRQQPGAVIEDPGQARGQALRIAAGEAIQTLDEGLLQIRADTLCQHGEGPQA